MRKRVLALLMAATMVFGAAGCGKKDTNTITVWVAENVVDFTKEKVSEWQKQSEANAQFKVILKSYS